MKPKVEPYLIKMFEEHARLALGSERATPAAIRKKVDALIKEYVETNTPEPYMQMRNPAPTAAIEKVNKEWFRHGGIVDRLKTQKKSAQEIRDVLHASVSSIAWVFLQRTGATRDRFLMDFTTNCIYQLLYPMFSLDPKGFVKMLRENIGKKNLTPEQRTKILELEKAFIRSRVSPHSLHR